MMNIKSIELLPFPIKNQGYENTEIWGKHISFEPCKSYLLCGGSGRGKTTMLSVIFGMRKDYTGNVFIDSKNISEYSQSQWDNIRRTKISFMFQGLKLFDELSGYENIEIKNKLTGIKSKNEIYEMAEFLGVSALMEKKAQKLSFGQIQRLALIRALCQPFEYLLLDEPFSHIDEINISKSIELIKQECQSHSSGLILSSLSDNNSFDYETKYRV